MAYFDFLNNQENAESDANAEYIYNHTQIWKVPHHYFTPDILIPKYSIVTNVKLMPNKSYEFDFEGERYQCNYAWAFIKNTPENKILIKEKEILNNKIEKLTDERDKLTRKLCKLWDGK